MRGLKIRGMKNQSMILILLILGMVVALIWGLVVGVQLYGNVDPQTPPIDVVHLIHLSIVFVLGLTAGMFYAVSNHRKTNTMMRSWIILVFVATTLLFVIGITMLLPQMLGYIPIG